MSDNTNYEFRRSWCRD